MSVSCVRKNWSSRQPICFERCPVSAPILVSMTIFHWLCLLWCISSYLMNLDWPARSSHNPFTLLKVGLHAKTFLYYTYQFCLCRVNGRNWASKYQKGTSLTFGTTFLNRYSGWGLAFERNGDQNIPFLSNARPLPTHLAPNWLLLFLCQHVYIIVVWYFPLKLRFWKTNTETIGQDGVRFEGFFIIIFSGIHLG